MEREKLIEELATGLWEDRNPHQTWIAMEREDYLGHARAALERLNALGLCVVPKEPTPEMVEAGGDKICNEMVCNQDCETGCSAKHWVTAHAYRAMIAAATSTPQSSTIRPAS